MLIHKLTRALIKRAQFSPWILIPGDGIDGIVPGILTNGAIAFNATSEDIKRFTFAVGKDIDEGDPKKGVLLRGLDFSEAAKVKRTCLLSDAESKGRLQRIYVEEKKGPLVVVYRDAFLDLVCNPEILYIQGDMGVDDIREPTLWIMKIRWPETETAFREMMTTKRRDHA